MGDPWYTQRTFYCIQCGFKEDRTLKSFDVKDPCPKCDYTLQIMALPRLTLMRTSVQNPEWNPGLGQVVNSRQHREEIVKQKGLIELGNETPDTLHKESVVKRQLEKEKEWNDL